MDLSIVRLNYQRVNMDEDGMWEASYLCPSISTYIHGCLCIYIYTCIYTNMLYFIIEIEHVSSVKADVYLCIKDLSKNRLQIAIKASQSEVACFIGFIPWLPIFVGV